MNPGRTGFTPTPRDLAEVFMMLDFIAGKPNLKIDDIRIEWGRLSAKKPAKVMKIPELLAELRTIELRYINSTKEHPASALDADEAGLMQLVKDALTGKTNPASGATIAYTNLYVRRRPKISRHGTQDGFHGGYELLAHPELEVPANWHRRINNALVCVVLIIAMWALWESSSVTLGKSILQARQDLRVRQAALATEKIRAMTSPTKANDWALPPLVLPDETWNKDLHLTFDFCERPRIWALVAEKDVYQQYKIAWPHGFDVRTGKASKDTLQVFETPQQQEVCDRDSVLREQFAISSQEMAEYVNDWTRLVGAPFGLNFTPPGLKMTQAYAEKTPVAGQAAVPGTGDAAPPAAVAAGNTDNSGQDGDTEIRLAPKLLVHGNFLLPVIFAFLGAAAHVVLEFYTKLQTSTLTPDDRDLGLIRLVLGMVVGTCIGLAFSSTVPAPDKTVTDLVASLSLTASGISFLAGFGVEGVFDMLGQVVKRVFPSQLPVAK
jgi:hypothetical protein